MSRPLAIRYAADGTTFQAIEEMNDVRIEYPVYQICQAIANQQSVGGNLTIGMNSGTGTPIGTFIDTYRPQIVGSHPATTTPSSVTYAFSQIVNSGSVSPTSPVEYSAISSGGSVTTGVRQMSLDNIRTELFDRVALKLGTTGLGSYILAPSAPVSSGDTWTQIHSITDTIQTGNNTTYIWRKTAESIPAPYRPLKVINTAGDLREMSDTDLQNLFDSYANYVIATGRGKYLLQETAPAVAGQTWVQMGTSLSDNRNQLKNVSYSGTYAGSYTGAVSSAYTSAVLGYYVKRFTGTYNRGFRRTYATSNSSLYYQRAISKPRDVEYAGTRDVGFVGTRDVAFGKTDLETYTGLTVSSTIDKISTVNLWLRTK
jgi:hypothetical protein